MGEALGFVPKDSSEVALKLFESWEARDRVHCMQTISESGGSSKSVSNGAA